ncbi:unnamed protein product, partial [Staurois parvus]
YAGCGWERERAQAGAGVSKVSIIGVSGRNNAPSLVSLIPMMALFLPLTPIMGHYFPPTDTNVMMGHHRWCQWEE